MGLICQYNNKHLLWVLLTLPEIHQSDGWVSTGVYQDVGTVLQNLAPQIPPTTT